MVVVFRTQLATKRIDLRYDLSGLADSITRYGDTSGTQEVAASVFGRDGAGLLKNLLHTQPLLV